MRRLSFYRKKKLRGLRRRLRDLGRWADSFIGYFPKVSELQDNYWEEKIPIESNLVEGAKSRIKIKKECITSTIRACSNLIQSKPDYAQGYRVICLIVEPHLFPSRICVWKSINYYKSYASECDTAYVECKRNTTKSLVKKYGLLVPMGMREVGYDIAEKENGVVINRITHWFIGEIDND